jgi:hypothetical protein
VLANNLSLVWTYSRSRNLHPGKEALDVIAALLQSDAAKAVTLSMTSRGGMALPGAIPAFD